MEEEHRRILRESLLGKAARRTSFKEALLAIYAKETDRENKEAVLNSLFIQGNAHALVTIARSEKDPQLKKTAVSKLAIMNSKEGNDYLMELLQK